MHRLSDVRPGRVFRVREGCSVRSDRPYDADSELRPARSRPFDASSVLHRTSPLPVPHRTQDVLVVAGAFRPGGLGGVNRFIFGRLLAVTLVSRPMG